MIVPSGAVEALQSRKRPDLTQLRHPEIAVLRAGAPERTDDDPDRDWTGFHVDFSEKELLAALSGWWRCDPARVAATGVMPVTVAGFVVAVLTGLDEWIPDGGTGTSLRYRFTSARLAGYLTDLTVPVNRIASAPTGTDDRRLADLLLGTRLEAVSGGPIAYVPTHPATDPASAEGE
ncbi:DNA-binding protein [Kitasatospora sp. NPDC059088]|uniref:DNA-binding protein n=1 Tax=Kitasatospora sp. NPDC059088 TaxID=3346722 RepID=UPI0036A95A72